MFDSNKLLGNSPLGMVMAHELKCVGNSQLGMLMAHELRCDEMYCISQADWGSYCGL